MVPFCVPPCVFREDQLPLSTRIRIYIYEYYYAPLKRFFVLLLLLHLI